MRFNKDQREGIAKIADNLATASMVAAVVSGFIDNKIGWPTIVALSGVFVVLVFVGVVMRKEGGRNGD